MANTAQVLEVEEHQRGRGLRIAGGADHRLRRQMHQIGDTLQVDGKDVANEKDVGPDSLRGVCLIEKVEDPAVLSQHRGIGQGDATGMSRSCRSVAVRRASRKMMHEGAVRVMAEGASRRALPVTRGTAYGGVVMAPAGKTPETKGRRRQVEGVHGVLPDREEVVRGRQQGRHAKSDTMAESL